MSCEAVRKAYIRSLNLNQVHPTLAADRRAQLHTASRRYDYQINIPRQPNFKHIVKQAIKIMHSVEECERLEVCDNGLFICWLHRDDVGKGDKKTKGIKIEISPATNGSEVKDINHAYLEYKGKTPTANLEFSQQYV